jgi:membrane protein required for colicin V production
LNFIDLIILFIAAIGFILGFKDGFIRKVIGFAGFILAVVLAINYASDLGRYMERVLGIEYYLSELIAGMTIFILTIFMFAVLKRIIHPFDKVNNIINQLIGGIVGMIQILFFLSATLYLFNIFSIPSENTKKNSLVYGSVYNIIPGTIDLLSDYTPDAKKKIKDYINEKDTLIKKDTLIDLDSLIEKDTLNDSSTGSR